MNYSLRPFAKETPSVFVVCSPLQTLCALAAIEQLEIKDFKIIALFINNKIRNAQLKELLDYYKLNYKSIRNFTSAKFWLYYFFSLIPKYNRYKRLFVGDYRTDLFVYVGGCFVTNNADVVYLDDGNASVLLFENKYEDRRIKRELRLMRFFNKCRSFNLYKFFLTIYGGIANSRYFVEILDFNRCLPKQNNSVFFHNNEIVILGTCVNDYCESVGLTIDAFNEKLDNLLISIKNRFVDNKIVYIPHGRDNNTRPFELCEKYGIEYRPSEMGVEMDYVIRKNMPAVVIGFTSAALYNLKKMFPSIIVYNILFYPERKDVHTGEFEDISKYYETNGIKRIDEKFDC